MNKKLDTDNTKVRTISKWTEASSLGDLKDLVDRGVLLNYKVAKKVYRKFSNESKDFISYLTKRFCESYISEVQQEIIVESLLSWILCLDNVSDGVTVFLETLIESGAKEEGVQKFIRTCVNLEDEIDDEEGSGNTENEELFALGISCICEIGINLNIYEKQLSQAFENIPTLLNYISTYLLSVSDSSNLKVRLCLINYFVNIEDKKETKSYLNKIMERFGYSSLETIYQLLFKSKSENIAMQFLVENLPCILGCNFEVQRSIHDIWRFYLLKYPSNFCLFLKSFTTSLKELDDNHKLYGKTKESLFVQLSALLLLSSDINNQDIYYSILNCFLIFKKDPIRNQAIWNLIKKDEISLRKNIVEELKHIVSEESLIINPYLLKRRFDRFYKKEKSVKKLYSSSNILSLNQIQTLGNQSLKVG